MDNFSDVNPAECRLEPLPDGIRLNRRRTLILQSVINEIKEHGRSSMNKEVCGVFVGSLCRDDDGAYLRIDARIEGKFADHQAGSVTFTSETWDYIHQELAEKYPDRKIVGWYHTHPGFGIFLSNMDFFIHENFFGIKWQPAYVYDPQAETDGFFFWQDRNLERDEIVVVPDQPALEGTPAIGSGEKISIAITDEEEEREHKKRLAVAAVTILILLLGLSSGIAIFFLYSSNRQLEHDLKHERSLQNAWLRRLQDEYGRLRGIDLRERETLSGRFNRQIISLREEIAKQQTLIARLNKRLGELMHTHSDDEQSIRRLKAALAETGKKMLGLQKQLDGLRRQELSMRYPAAPQADGAEAGPNVNIHTDAESGWWFFEFELR